MNWFEILLFAPFWGTLSTHLFIQAWFGVLLACVSLAAIPVRGVSIGTKLLGAGVSLFSAVLFSCLLWAGHWVVDWLGLQGRGAANVVFWIFAAIAALFSLAQMPPKLRKAWRNATIPGSLEDDIIKRRMGLNPEVD